MRNFVPGLVQKTNTCIVPVANKPFSQACENNKAPILSILKQVLIKPATVWEIGSGTGQHACHFASELPHLTWQPTDLPEHHPGINAWRNEAQLPNLRPPLELDVTSPTWPCDGGIEAFFTANTLHIMSWQKVETLFEKLGTYLNPSAIVCIYGPFNYNGQFTSESNARFDEWLLQRDPESGIRDFEAVTKLAKLIGLILLEDNAMPANNRLLIFQKSS